MSDHPLSAVVWDYDGTLVDTRRRNMSVNRSIVQEISGEPWTSFPPLASLESYGAAQERAANWQDFYRSCFGFTDEQILLAGQRWTPHQEADPTPTPLFEGIRRAIVEVAHLPQGHRDVAEHRAAPAASRLHLGAQGRGLLRAGEEGQRDGRLATQRP